MSKTVQVKIDKAGIGALLKSAPLRADLTARMERVLAAAQGSAPVDTGDYQSRLHLEQVTTDRAVVRVVDDSDHAMFVEAKHGTLARALDAAG